MMQPKKGIFRMRTDNNKKILKFEFWITVCDIGSKSASSKPLIMDTLKNLADFWIPMSSLGHVNLPPFLIGILGIISSITSALPLVDPITYKLQT